MSALRAPDRPGPQPPVAGAAGPSRAAPGRVHVQDGALAKVLRGAAHEHAEVREVVAASVRRGKGEHVVHATLAVAIPYGEPAGEVADRVRRHTRDRVEALSGIRLGRIDVEVTAFATPSTGRWS